MGITGSGSSYPPANPAFSPTSTNYGPSCISPTSPGFSPTSPTLRNISSISTSPTSPAGRLCQRMAHRESWSRGWNKYPRPNSHRQCQKVGWRNTRSYYAFIQDLATAWDRRPVRSLDLAHQHDRLRLLKLSHEDSGATYVALSASVKTHNEICQLLYVTPDSNAGLLYMSLGLFHPNSKVRASTVDMLKRTIFLQEAVAYLDHTPNETLVFRSPPGSVLYATKTPTVSAARVLQRCYAIKMTCVLKPPGLPHQLVQKHYEDLLQNPIAPLAILASFPLLPHLGIILPPSTPILMAIALQTSCI